MDAKNASGTRYRIEFKQVAHWANERRRRTPGERVFARIKATLVLI